MAEYFQVIRHIPQDDGSVLDVPTNDIFRNEEDAKKLASNDSTGIFAFCGITKSYRKITKEQLDRFFMRNIK